jgi:hypothetical protein
MAKHIVFLLPQRVESCHDRSFSRRIQDDYSRAGAYFVTICAWNRECLFGEILKGEVRQNEYGRVV